METAFAKGDVIDAQNIEILLSHTEEQSDAEFDIAIADAESADASSIT